MAIQARTPTKRPAKAAAGVAPKTAEAAPETVNDVAPVTAPTEAAPLAAAPVEAAPVKVAPVKAAPVEAAPAASASEPKGFEFPKFEFPKFDFSKFELPKFELPTLEQPEVPVVLRDFAEKAVAQAKANFDKLKLATEEATDAIEDTYEATRAGVVEYSGKSIDAVKTNSNAALGHAKDLLGVKTFAEAIELQSSFVRQQYDLISAQTKELQSLATKLAGDAVKPAKEAFEKAAELIKKVD